MSSIFLHGSAVEYLPSGKPAMVDGQGWREDIAVSPDSGAPPDGQAEGAQQTPRGWRYWLGLVLLVLSLALPLIALVLVPLLGFPEGVNVVLFGLSLAGGPELLLVLAISAMGKENIDRIFGKLLPWFKRIARWDTVTRGRYILGLWILAVAVLIPWLLIYLWEESLAGADGKPDWGFYVIIGANLAFIASIFIMGAPLWQRLQALFTWDAEIRFPSKG